MLSPNPAYRIGDAEITRIEELALHAFTPATLYPDQDPAALARHRHHLRAGSVVPGSDVLVQSVHCWLVRTPEHVVLIDTGAGNGKARPTAALNDLNEPFLTRLAAAGVQPDDVDFVLLTHLHADHVGWNTTRTGASWVPTFRNARHLFSRVESDYVGAVVRGEEPNPAAFSPGLGPMLRRPGPNFYEDSVQPVIEAGLVDFVKVDGGEVLEGFSFLPTPGHSIDHASIRLVSRGEEALFAGDVAHHPLQVYDPGLHSCFCEFPDAAQRSRFWALAEAADRKVPVFSTHFAESSVGRVRREAGGFAWTFL